MSERSRSKWIMVGAVIGLLIGGLAGFLISPSPDISGYQEQIEQLETQVTTFQDRAQDLEEELENVVSSSDYITLENQYNELNSQLTILQSEIEDYSDLETVVTQLLSELEDVVSFDEYVILESQYNELNSQLTVLQSEIDEKEDTINELQETISDLEALAAPLPPEEGEPGSSMFFPADIGTPVTCVFTDWFDEYSAQITIKEVIRGTVAWSMILDANMFNDPPLEGYEYVLVKIKFKLISAPTPDTEYRTRGGLFDAVSNDGQVYEGYSTVVPDPEFYQNIRENLYSEGWAAYQVYETDDKPVLLFADGGVWFKLYE